MEAPLEDTTPEAGARVVLVHGIYDTGKIFDALAAELRAHGHHVIAPSLTPSNASVPLEELAGQLERHIHDAYGDEDTVHVIAFSMGGLISRYYLEYLGGHTRCGTLITLSTPHHGSLLAKFAWGEGIRQMRPGSAFIDRLRAGEHTLEGMEVRSYWTPYDLMILPASSSVWDAAEVIEVPVALHPWMVTDRRIRADLVDYLDGVRA